jgi:HEPN domain-containing protein
MRPEALREAREWLARADRDLQVADRALHVLPPLADAGAYHAQQAGEKSLKAFLTAHDQVFRLTHDLRQLLPSCEAIDPDFSRFLPAAQLLTPYATQFRYPGGPIEPALSDAEQALQLATDLVHYVRERLSK